MLRVNYILAKIILLLLSQNKTVIPGLTRDLINVCSIRLKPQIHRFFQIKIHFTNKTAERFCNNLCKFFINFNP
ncbi:MAG: hypothetical protein JWP12_1680 [Bacteroidetes bacterium]|nr:hypothetical protein [Bacteroidota bacterium]